MEVNDDRPEESAFLSAQVERLYSLLRQASLAERPLSTDEDRELAFWRQRVDAHEWAELERDAHMHASRSPSPGGTDPSPAREWLGSGERAPREERARFPGALPQAAPLADVHFDDGRASACAGVERLAHDVVPWMVRPPSTRARAEPGGAAGAWHSGACACDSPLAVGGAIERSAQTQCSSSDAIAAALSAAHEEHSRRQHELEREHQRALAQLAASHARQLIQAQRDKGALRDELERACDEWRASERGLYARVAHAELELAEKELELAHARAQAKTLRARADRLELRVADVELSRAAAASPQACGTSTLPSQSGTGSSASPSPPAGGAIAGDGSEERLRTLRSEIDLLLGIQGGRVRTAASEVGSLLGGATRLSRAPGGDGPAELSPLPSPLRRAAGISDGARARALAKGCLAIRAQVRLAKQQLAWLGRGVIESLRQTEAEWNRFVSTFSRLWEATVVGTEMLAADVGAAREAARGLDEHSARLDRALRARASVPTRVLAVAALPAPGDAVRCALDVRAQSIEVAEGPERRIFRFDRVAAIDTGATALPGLAPELGEAVDAVGAGGCATIIVDGPRGCGKSWLLDGSASEKGGDGLLGGAVHGLLAAIGELASAQPPQLCALWLSAVDVAGDVVTDLLAARALPRSCAVPSYERREGLHSQGSAVQPQLAAIPTYESFVQLNAHLRARIGTSVSGAERAAGQWLGAFSLKGCRSHCAVSLHLERSTATSRLGTTSLTLVELAAAGHVAGYAPAAVPVGTAGAQQASVGKSVAAVHGVLIALASGASRVPYRNSRLTAQLQQQIAASGLVLVVLPVLCAALSPADDACRTLAIGSHIKALELTALSVPSSNGAPKSAPIPARSAPPSAPSPTLSVGATSRGLSSPTGSRSPGRAHVRLRP